MKRIENVLMGVGIMRRKRSAFELRRFGDGSDIRRSVEEGLRAAEEFKRTGVFPEWASVPHFEVCTSHEKRLAYYRSHGLDKCDDYLGGDGQFEADVLSGAYHDFGVSLDPVKREDAYVIERMNDGRFKYDSDFIDFGLRPEVRVAYMRNAGKNGFMVKYDYPHGSPEQFVKDVESGRYARRMLLDEP